MYLTLGNNFIFQISNIKISEPLKDRKSFGWIYMELQIRKALGLETGLDKVIKGNL